MRQRFSVTSSCTRESWGSQGTVGVTWVSKPTPTRLALIPGFAAREVAVAALGTVYAVADPESATAVLATTLAGQWSLATGLAFLAWYIFAPQCVATLGVVRRETNSSKWM